MQFPHSTVTQRANSFPAIRHIVSNEPGTSANIMPLALNRATEKQMIKARRLPLIVGRSIVFGTRTLDLSSSPMTLELYRTFIEAKTHRASKYDIAARVYGVLDPEKRSERSWNATKLNITKMISRSRKQAAETLTPDDNLDIAWFPYNPVEEVWELYSIRGNSFPDWSE